MKRTRTGIFLLSASLMAYQVFLVKLLAIQYWHHFAFLIVGIALLGFGASGTALVYGRPWLERRQHAAFFALPLLCGGAMPLAVMAPILAPFNPLLILWRPLELVRLLFLGGVFFLPFLLGAMCIGFALTREREHPHGLYCANLAGSGLGCLVFLVAWLHPPLWLLPVLTAATAVAAGAVFVRTRRQAAAAIGTLLLVAAVPLLPFLRSFPFLSPYKDLSQARAMAGAQTEWEQFGPHGLLTVLDSPAFHYVPDLGLLCPHPLPPQKGLFLDGNLAGALSRADPAAPDLLLLACRTASLAYQLLSRPHVLVIGSGTGTDILAARLHGAASVTAVEMNADLVRLLQGPYGDFCGHVYRPGTLALHLEEARGYLERPGPAFDLIHIGLLEPMAATTGGLYSLNENYLFTVESFRRCLRRLRPSGLVSVSRWVTNPPRDAVKLFAMAAAALEAEGCADPGGRLALIQSWQTATLLIGERPFTQGHADRIRSFCTTHAFDPVWHPGMDPDEAHRLHRTEGPPLADAVRCILSPRRAAFLDAYPFAVHPSTDDRPFFSHVFRWQLFTQARTQGDRAWIPFLDWAYLLAWASLVFVFAAGAFLILAPLARTGAVSGGKKPILGYFGAIGLAYLFLEMALLQQMIRVLGDPVFAAGVVLGAILLFSGLGSLAAGRLQRVTPGRIACWCLALGMALAPFLAAPQKLPTLLASLPLGARMPLCGLFLAPLAFVLGMPFPLGLRRLGPAGAHAAAWAWGINGFASVSAAPAAVLLAMARGFSFVIAAALVLYLAAALIYLCLGRPEETHGPGRAQDAHSP